MLTAAERYLAESEDADFLASSGYTFVVGGLLSVEWGELLGGMPALTARPADVQEYTDQVRKRNDYMQRHVFERKCRGVKDIETGQVTPVPFEKLIGFDAAEIYRFALERGGLGGKRADQVRRSLREPGLLPDAGRDGEGVLEAAVLVDGAPA